MLNKALFTIALLLSMSNSAIAQKGANTPKTIVGIRGGVTLAPTDWGLSDIQLFPSAGVAVSFNITQLPFYIETGAYYTNRFVFDYDNHSLLAPALLTYHFPLKKDRSLQPFMGLFLSYGFNERTVDGGWRIGVGFNDKHFYANCGYDISANYGVNADALFVSIGYNF